VPGISGKPGTIANIPHISNKKRKQATGSLLCPSSRHRVKSWTTSFPELSMLNHPAMRAAALAASLLICADSSRAQSPDTTPLPPAFRQPMPLYKVGLGPYTWAIATQSREAQKFFDQGVQLLYSFTPEDAARSFREAEKLDPNCAMCFFGEAWAWGPYLNGPMPARNSPRAFAAAQRALKLSARAKPIEQALINAMSIRYRAAYDSATHFQLARVYADSLARVHARNPNNLDVGTMYAEALMLLEPRRGVWEPSKPSVQKIHQVLESILARDVNHPGACHLLIHATESSTRAGAAEHCANFLGQAIPGASHINHMPSHTFNRIGRWGDAVRANIEAWHSDLRAKYGEGFAIYPEHNLHMLLYSASYDGQGAIAMQAAKDYTKIVNGGSFYRRLTMVRFGRFDEVLELASEPAPRNPIYTGLSAFATGYAHLRLGHADSARVYLERVDQIAASTGDSITFRGHTAKSLLGITGGILRAELLRSEGKGAEAVSALENAVTLEDALRYDEPEPLPFTARHWLGAALLAANRAADAEKVYRADLEKHPHNGWSLFGLGQALRAQNKTTDADRVRLEFVGAWSRSDTMLRGSTY
jgi:tetratricopeptide (TPR) repeat protein